MEFELATAGDMFNGGAMSVILVLQASLTTLIGVALRMFVEKDSKSKMVWMKFSRNMGWGCRQFCLYTFNVCLF